MFPVGGGEDGRTHAYSQRGRRKTRHWMRPITKVFHPIGLTLRHYLAEGQYMCTISRYQHERMVSPEYPQNCQYHGPPTLRVPRALKVLKSLSARREYDYGRRKGMEGKENRTKEDRRCGECCGRARESWGFGMLRGKEAEAEGEKA